MLPVLVLLPPPSSLVSQVWAMWPRCYKCPWFAVIRALALELSDQHTQSKTRGYEARVHLELEPYPVCSEDVSPRARPWAEENLPILLVEGTPPPQLPMYVSNYSLGWEVKVAQTLCGLLWCFLPCTHMGDRRQSFLELMVPQNPEATRAPSESPC